MNRNEAKVRVRLDTSGAKAELADLTRHGHATAGRIGDGIKGAIGSGVRAMGMGAAFGAGLNAIRGPLDDSAGGIASDMFGGFGASIEHGILGDMGPEARAAAQVREQAKEIFGHVAGRTGSIPPEAHAYRQAMMPIVTEREKGRAMFDRAKEFRASDIRDGEANEKIAKGFAEGFRGLADTMMRAMGGSGW